MAQGVGEWRAKRAASVLQSATTTQDPQLAPHAQISRTNASEDPTPALIIGPILEFRQSGKPHTDAAPSPCTEFDSSTSPAATAVASPDLICQLCKHVCTDATVLVNAVCEIPSCAHLFCASCIAPHVSQHMNCPACSMFCAPAMLQPDVRARRDISTLLAQRDYTDSIHLGLPERHHQHWSAQDKADALSLWDSQGWHAVRSKYATLAWTTAKYWRDHPGIVADRSPPPPRHTHTHTHIHTHVVCPMCVLQEASTRQRWPCRSD